jgi:hypothetical protein
MGGSATDDYILDCCGTSADTTAVTWDFTVNLTTGTLLIRGNRSDPAGFYTGNAVTSSSHYRLTPGNTANGFVLNEPNSTVDGIQVESAHTGASGTGITYTTTGAVTIRKCRVLNTSSTDVGIGRDGSAVGGSATKTFENNLVVGFQDSQIRGEIVNNFSPTYHIQHNTCYGGVNGIVVHRGGGSGAPVQNVKANAIAGTSGNDIIEVGTNGTVNYDDNATEDFDLATNGEIDLGAPTDAWGSPGTTSSSVFTVKDTSSSLYQTAAGALVSTDIRDLARDGVNYDVGCFEFFAAAGGAAGPLTRSALTRSALTMPRIVQ